mgnify:CR=1 FL=1
MPSITITLSDAEYAALSLVAVDPHEWISNFAKARADSAISEFQASPAWPSPLISAVPAGVDVQEVPNVLAHGISTGLLKTAAQREAAAEAAREAFAAAEREAAEAAARAQAATAEAATNATT